MTSLLKRIGGTLKLFTRSRVIRSGSAPLPWLDWYAWVQMVVSCVALSGLILEYGYQVSLKPWTGHLLDLVYRLCIALLVVESGIRFFRVRPWTLYLKRCGLDWVLIGLTVFQVLALPLAAGLSILRLTGLFFFSRVTQGRGLAAIIRRIRLNAAQAVAFSFLGTILLGALLLTFPAATENGQGASVIDALFTATSATCVTGLIVQDTPGYFSGFGQTVILALIQIGGLGIMTYSAFVALLFGRFGLGQRKIVQEMMEEERNVYGMIFYIVRLTLVVETFGAIILFMRWRFDFESPWKTLYFSVFHSISAFCNAGFSLFSDSLVRYSGDPVVNGTVIVLIITGGVGFIVVHEAVERMRGRRRKMSLHTVLVLWVSGILILFGFFMIFYFEFDHSLIHMELGSKLQAALFQSVTTRTAGFNTVDIAAMAPVTLTGLILLMFIGASPGSTGGGIKTTTFAVLLLTLRCVFLGRKDVEIRKVTIFQHIVYRAVAIVLLGVALVIIIFSLLMIFEQAPRLDLLFETVSAFGTVGLSMGVTPTLSTIGKLLIIVLMFIGRVGALTMGLALAKERRPVTVSYPGARLLIG